MTATSNSDEPDVPIVCPECETTSRVSLADVADSVARHNELHHDGEDVATVDPDLLDSIADLAANDLGLLEGPD